MKKVVVAKIANTNKHGIVESKTQTQFVNEIGLTYISTFEESSVVRIGGIKIAS